MSTADYNKQLEISIHTALAGCDSKISDYSILAIISIHTALAGCDEYDKWKCLQIVWISIHTALAGCDMRPRPPVLGRKQFQSTQPSQAVTYIIFNGPINNRFQSTQPSQAVTRKIGEDKHTTYDFNPHSPRRL